MCGCETLSFGLREENGLRGCENRVLRKVIGAKRDEATGGWRKVGIKELHDLYWSADDIRVMSRGMRWTVDRQWRTECGINLSQDRDRWRAVVNAVMNLQRAPQNSGNILSRRGAVSFSKRALLYEVSETNIRTDGLFLSVALPACSFCLPSLCACGEGGAACIPQHRCVYVVAYVQSGDPP